MRISDLSSDVCSSDLAQADAEGLELDCDRAAEPAATTTPAAAVLRHRDRKLAARKEARRLARQRDKVRPRQRVDHALAFQSLEEAGAVQLAEIEADAQIGRDQVRTTVTKAHLICCHHI